MFKVKHGLNSLQAVVSAMNEEAASVRAEKRDALVQMSSSLQSD